MKLIGRVDSSEGHYAREKEDLVNSLHRRGIVGDNSTLDDILKVEVDHVLNRRLQSQVYYRGLASSMRQARQLVVHGHIAVGAQKMTVPSYLVTRNDENTLTYHHTSPLTNPEHPIRKEIEEIRASAGEDEESGTEAPSEEFVAGIAAGAEAAPDAESTVVEGGDE
jgi:small subunit ribosomal protein S4